MEVNPRTNTSPRKGRVSNMSAERITLGVLIAGLVVAVLAFVPELLDLVGINPHGVFAWLLGPWPSWLVWVLATIALAVGLFAWYGRAVLELCRRQREARAAEQEAKAREMQALGREAAARDIEAIETAQREEATREESGSRWARQAGSHATLDKLQWLHRWHPRHRYGQASNLDNERAFQLINELTTSGVLDAFERRAYKSLAFEKHLAKTIAAEETRLGVPPPPPPRL